MEWNLFIIPATIIIVQLIKYTLAKYASLDTIWLPYLAVGLGGSLGALFALYYGGDIFYHIFHGAIYGASAAGFYDSGDNTITLVKQLKNE